MAGFSHNPQLTIHNLEVSDSRAFGFETRMLHAGQVPDPYVGARAVPIYQTTSYVFGDSDEAAHLFELKQYGNIYSRISNPTTAVLEERLASLENGTGAVAVASGMAAQFAVFMTLASPGDHFVASNQLYGGTSTQMTHTLKKLSIDVTFVDPRRPRRLGGGDPPDHTRPLRRDRRQPRGPHRRPRSHRQPRQGEVRAAYRR